MFPGGGPPSPFYLVEIWGWELWYQKNTTQWCATLQFSFFHTTAVLENTQYEICKKVLHWNFLWMLRAHKQSFIFNLHTSAAQNI